MKLETKSTRSYLMPVICFLVISIVLYPLSAPPLFAIWTHGYLPITEEQFYGMYTPVIYLWDRYEWFEVPFSWYEELWWPLYADGY